MSSVPCTNCGAEISPGTKFCRRCGQPSLDTASVSEATTRVFEATAERKSSPTENWNAQPTGPAYLSPSGNSRGASPQQQPQDATTKSLAPATGQRQQVWIAVSIVALLIVVFVALAIGTMIKVARKAATTQTPPVVVRPETGIPPAPPAPPVVEPPAAGATVPTSELMYPGAETVMDMKSPRDNFLELRTPDPLNKVVDWYTTKLKSAEIMRAGGTEAILRTGRTSVIISTRGNTTDILIKQGAER